MLQLTKLAVFLCFISLSFISKAQNVQVNPSVEWKFIISQELIFESGNFIIYEFPAEKNFDYRFNITHNQDSLHAVIMVYDMQDGLVDKILVDNSLLSVDLPFDVPLSGTYKVVVGLTDIKEFKGKPIESVFTLIHRAKI